MLKGYDKYPQGEITNKYMESMWNKKVLATPRALHDHIAKVRGDSKTVYRVNDYQFRGPEMTELTEMVFAGCSMTFGSGIYSESDIWGNIVAKNLGVSATNIAMPGVGILWIIDRLFEYFNTHGNPEYVMCLFPGFTRIETPIDGRVYSTKNDGYSPDTMSPDGKQGYCSVHVLAGDMDRPKYVKMPYDPKIILTHELGIDLGVRSLRYLEAYCKAAGIKLLWTIWEMNESSFIDTLPSELKFENYFSAKEYIKPGATKLMKENTKYVFYDDMKTFFECNGKHKNAECSCYTNCHEEERIQFSNDKEFDLGLDFEESYFYAHPGVHFQIHCAEAFMRKLKEMQ